MRRLSISTVLAVTMLLAVACRSTKKEAAEPTPRDETVVIGNSIAYEGPQQPGDSEWLLRSLNGRDAAEGSDVSLLFPERGELAVEGGCMGSALYHELEGAAFDQR